MLSMLRRKPRVLLLDDDTSMQRLVGAMLQAQGYRVDIVGAGAQAIEKIGRYDYAALLLDVMTPTEGGLTVIRHLREKKPQLLKRVMLLTASPDSVLKGVAGDIFGIIHKPFEQAQLIEMLARVVGR